MVIYCSHLMAAADSGFREGPYSCRYNTGRIQMDKQQIDLSLLDPVLAEYGKV